MEPLRRKLDDGDCEETGATVIAMRVETSSSRIYHALTSGGEGAWHEQLNKKQILTAFRKPGS